MVILQEKIRVSQLHHLQSGINMALIGLKVDVFPVNKNIGILIFNFVDISQFLVINIHCFWHLKKLFVLPCFLEVCLFSKTELNVGWISDYLDDQVTSYCSQIPRLPQIKKKKTLDFDCGFFMTNNPYSTKHKTSKTRKSV